MPIYRTCDAGPERREKWQQANAVFSLSIFQDSDGELVECYVQDLIAQTH